MSLSGTDRVLQQYWRQDMGRPALLFTPLGGLAVQVNALEALYQGEIVRISTLGGAFVKKSSIGSDMPVGCVYQDASSGETVYVVVAGIGYVKPYSSTTAAAGYICYVSASSEGRADGALTLPSVDNHNREIGHYLNAGSSAGAPTLAIIHWN